MYKLMINAAGFYAIKAPSGRYLRDENGQVLLIKSIITAKAVIDELNYLVNKETNKPTNEKYNIWNDFTQPYIARVFKWR